MKNPDDSVRLLFVMAAALEKKGSFDSSVTVFESILKIRPEHSQSLNYLAYMLAERGVRLDYATELVQNALAIIPDNGAYIDSYGWILYKKGNFRGALEQMLRAYNYISNDATILEHLGDVYQALADSANARIFWKRALEIDPGNRAIKEKLEQ
jgi:tetratricopeptide (TPR) repeat protein